MDALPSSGPRRRLAFFIALGIDASLLWLVSTKAGRWLFTGPQNDIRGRVSCYIVVIPLDSGPTPLELEDYEALQGLPTFLTQNIKALTPATRELLQQVKALRSRFTSLSPAVRAKLLDALARRFHEELPEHSVGSWRGLLIRLVQTA